MADPLFSPVFRGLETALDIHQRRHQVLASNLANVETPGYQAKDLAFRAALARAFDAQAEGLPAGGSEPAVVDDADGAPRADGNTVDVDLQMAKLAANGGRYNTLARILSKRFRLLGQAIEGAR